jgi:hypoxanthine phosphoribosyltransferase
VDFIVVSSYGESTVSSGKVRIIKDIYSDLENQNVIIVEDIVDTGLTINFLFDLFRTRNPKKVSVCTLLFKPDCFKLEEKPEYVGFEIGNVFVAGYGLDLFQYYRNVPYVGEVNLEWRPEK